MKRLIKLTAIMLLLILIILLFDFILIFSISNYNSGNVETHQTEYKLNDMNPLKLVVIDSCEYLYGPWGNATVLTHKGNCKNKQH